MKRFWIASIVILLAGCNSDPATTPDQSQAPTGTYAAPTASGSVDSTAPTISRPQTPVVVVPANKEISSQPTDVPKCEPVKKKVGVAKHVTPARHRHHKKIVAPNVAVVPKTATTVIPPAPAATGQPYDLVDESAKDRCTRTGGWWNIAVPYCEYQMP